MQPTQSTTETEAGRTAALVGTGDLLALLRERGAYEVLHKTAKWMHGELADYHAKNGREDIAARFQQKAIELSKLAHDLLC
jgi:hypothetical protein